MFRAEFHSAITLKERLIYHKIAYIKVLKNNRYKTTHSKIVQQIYVSYVHILHLININIVDASQIYGCK